MPVNFPSDITVTRFSAGDYIDGVWTAGAWVDDEFVPADDESTTVTVHGNIQDPSNSDVRTAEAICRAAGKTLIGAAVLRCNEPVYADDPDTLRPADRFPFEGRTYAIIKVTHRSTLPALAHYRALGALIAANTEDASL